MKNKTVLLVKTLLLSTSGRNILKYSQDKKKRNQIIGGYVGFGILYVMLAVYSALMSVGYGLYGFAEAIPTLCSLAVAIVAFLFTVLKVNGYLFNFREYELLMAMPFSTKTIAAARFLYMYLKSLPWYACITIPMLVGYGYFARPSVLSCLIWVVFALLLPIIPMVVATLLGSLIAKAGSGVKNKKMIQIVLTFALIILCLCLNFILNAVFKTDDIEVILGDIAGFCNRIGRYYPPAEWFRQSVSGFHPLNTAAFLLTTIGIFELFFWALGRYYRQINSSLKSSVAAQELKSRDIKGRSVIKSIAYKEWRRLIGSTVYITNACVGQIMAVILSVVVLCVGPDQIFKPFAEMEIDFEQVFPIIPILVHFMVGMIPTTACSPSLEGRNYWIIQSMPIAKKDLYKGKMLMNLYITIPFDLFATICLGITFQVGIPNLVLYSITGVILCLFSTCFGCLCGVKHMRLDWENEVEVIKQGAAVTVYILPMMLGSIALMAGIVGFGKFLNGTPVILTVMVIAAAMTAFCYSRVMRLAKE